MSSVAERVCNVIRDVLNDNETVMPSECLIDDLGFDDLDTLEMTMKLEDVFEIEIFDKDMEKWLVVGDVIRFIEKEVSR